jgi:hypothetical protein
MHGLPRQGPPAQLQLGTRDLYPGKDHGGPISREGTRAADPE